MNKNIIIIVIAIFLFVGCKSGSEENEREMMLPNKISLNIGDKFKLDPLINSSDSQYVYSCVDETIAEISISGIITAKDAGETSIVIDFEDVSGK